MFTRKRKNKSVGKVPLNRALSKLGIASRTVAEEWILAGKVKIDGVVRNNPAMMVVPEKIKIEVDGQSQEAREWKCILVNKPASCVVTRKDEKDRKTIFDVVGAEAEGLHAVGRLDYATTGLLILTNDTRLSSFLTDPVNEIPRTYIVTVRGEITDDKARRLRVGIQDDGELLKPSRLEVIKTSGKESHLKVELTEGKNREIRRMFKSIGNEVNRLKRVSFGSLELGTLQPGQFRSVTRDKIEKVARSSEE